MKLVTSSFYTKVPKKATAVIPPPALTVVKYHPGHYTTHFKGTNLSSGEILDELRDFPCNRGWQLRLNWAEMEGGSTGGDYTPGENIINGWLSLLASLNEDGKPKKRLILLIEFKSLGKPDRNVAGRVAPAYTRNATYGGGDMQYTSTEEPTPLVEPIMGGWVVNYTNANVRARMVALAQHFGNKYNHHENFEGIGSVEGAFQKPDGYSAAQLAIYNDQQWIGLLMFMTALKQSFPNCFVYLFCNYPQGKLPSIIRGGVFGDTTNGRYVFPGLVALGIGVGGPNTGENEYGLGGEDLSRPLPRSNQLRYDGIYWHYIGGESGLTSVSGQIPICLSGQRPDWTWTKIFPAPVKFDPDDEDGPLPVQRTYPAGGDVPRDANGNPSPAGVFNYAINTLNTNYFFVTRAAPDNRYVADYPKDAWGEIKAYWNANQTIKNNVTGGCKTTIPSSYEAVDMTG